MDQPPKPKQDARKPTWTDMAVPEPVRPAAPTRPLKNGDPDALVPAADPIVQAAYNRSGTLQLGPLMGKPEDPDALVIQKTARQTRVLNFHVEGIHWRAGFAPEIALTPLSQYVPSGEPPESEFEAGNGFVLRPVERDLELVLRDLVPAKLLAVGDEMFGPLRTLGGMYLYYVPQSGGGATVGMLAWYVAGLTGRPHLLYLQTEVRKGLPRLLDDMQKTFLASLAARQQHAGNAQPLDLWKELRLASTQLGATLRNSSLARNSQEVRVKVNAVRHDAENRLELGLNRTFRITSGLFELCFVLLPQRLLAAAVRLASLRLIGVIRWLDRVIAPRPPEDEF